LATYRRHSATTFFTSRPWALKPPFWTSTEVCFPMSSWWFCSVFSSLHFRPSWRTA